MRAKELLQNELNLLKRSRYKSIQSFKNKDISDELHKIHLNNLNPLIKDFENSIEILNNHSNGIKTLSNRHK